MSAGNWITTPHFFFCHIFSDKLQSTKLEPFTKLESFIEKGIFSIEFFIHICIGLIRYCEKTGGAFGGTRGSSPVPPEKGVFPLDHKKLCDVVLLDFALLLIVRLIESLRLFAFKFDY